MLPLRRLRLPRSGWLLAFPLALPFVSLAPLGAMAQSATGTATASTAAQSSGAAAAVTPPVATLPDVTVSAPRGPGRGTGSLTVATPAAERAALEQAPGAVRFITAEDFQQRRAFTLRDVLEDTPGVYVQDRYGQELRLSVRGSGIARAYHLRGVEILQDGIPMNAADGSGDFYQVDPLGIRSASVMPGANGLAYGASALGGAINFITPTAYTAEAPNIVRLEAGSYGTVRGSLQASRIVGDWDMLGTLTVSHADGDRQHSTSQYEQFNANLGRRFGQNVETRFYVGAYVTHQLLPGSLTLDQALHTPRMAASSALSGDQARDIWDERLANRTTFRTDWGRIDVDSWVQHKKLVHPIYQYLDQDSLNWGIAPRYTGTFNIAGLRNDLVVGLRYFAGNTTALQYVNNGGNRGTQTLNARQSARNYEMYAEDHLWVLPRLAVVFGAKMLRDERDYRDMGGGLSASRGALQLNRTYDGFNPKIGLLWQPSPAAQFYANLSRSQDVPDFTDLTQTLSSGSTGFVPLASQRAWTTEIGTRGHAGRFTWDLTLFHSVLRGQLLQYTTDQSIPASTFNAGTTVNQGVEFAGGAVLGRNILSGGDHLDFRQVWTFNDFRFRHDAQYGDNRIAGLPPHVLRSTLAYTRRLETPWGQAADGLRIAPTLDWVPEGAYVDYANTQRTPAYMKLNLEVSAQLSPRVSVFLDARNLTDKRYISDLGTVTDARTTSTAVYFPGERRSFYAGLRVAF